MRPCSRGFARRSPTAPRCPTCRATTRSAAPARTTTSCARFVAQVEELGGAVVSAVDARSAIASTLAAHGASRVVVAPDLPPALRPDGVELVEDGGLTPWELDALDGAVTTCAAACADTGTVALDGGPGTGTARDHARARPARVRRHARPGGRDRAGALRAPRAVGARRAGRSCSSRARPRRPTSGSSASRASTGRGASSSCSRRRPPYTVRPRGVAQPGRAPALGAGGRRFGSGHPDLARQAGFGGAESCGSIPAFGGAHP